MLNEMINWRFVLCIFSVMHAWTWKELILIDYLINILVILFFAEGCVWLKLLYKLVCWLSCLSSYAVFKVAQHLLGRDLEPWETIAVGALSGGLAAVTTTPFDVMKTRMMTAQGRSVSMSIVFLSILRHEGPLGLFKGAVPRFFWIAPLGAMNFAGYELARKAMDKHEEQLVVNQLSQKKVASTG